ncbi:hypothetical protein EDD16DRAFT_1515263 [Pisolithus croceorrhizus]|nr:hypothetical protein EDD16DRAFT_1515263 [Pisolithus croceorrhizus]
MASFATNAASLHTLTLSNDGNILASRAWDASWIDAGAWIAIGMCENVVQVLLLNSNLQLQSIFARWLKHTVPKLVAFTQCGNIYIFGLYDGNVVKMNTTDGVIPSEHCYGSVIGCAAVSLKKELVVIDNATNGFTLYSLDCEDLIQYFVTEPQSVPVPKQVAFGEESKIIVGGSDNGSMYLFERRMGWMLEKLTHSKMGLVQTITVWTHQYTSHKLAARPECQRTLKLTILTFLFILGVLGFGLQTVWLRLLLEKKVTLT